jgi:hypothetical protein
MLPAASATDRQFGARSIEHSTDRSAVARQRAVPAADEGAYAQLE